MIPPLALRTLPASEEKSEDLFRDSLGKTTVILRRGERFCALTLFDVAPGARIYQKGTKQIAAQLVKQPRKSFREWVDLHHTVVTIVLIFATLFLALEHLIVFLLSRER